MQMLYKVMYNFHKIYNIIYLCILYYSMQVQTTLLNSKELHILHVYVYFPALFS